MERRQDRQPGLDRRVGPDPDWLAKRLAAVPALLRIEESYAHARGHLLFRGDESPDEAVLDLVSGTGALVMGHHPKALRESLAEALAADPASALPRGVQAKGRELEERLCALMASATGRSWTCTLASTPAEAVELALRHAELERRRRVSLIEADRKRNLVEIRRALKAGRAHMSSTFYRDVARSLAIPTVGSFDEACFELTRFAKERAREASTFVTLSGAYFGRSTGTLALSWDPKERAPYAQYGLRSEFLHLDEIDDVDRFVKRHLRIWYDIDLDEEGLIHVCSRPYVDIGAIVVEPILYEGGVRPLPPEALQAIRALADKIGCPLVMDESRTAFGWTGSFLASSPAITADTYVLGAALGGGLAPLAALLIDGERHVPWSIRTPPTVTVGDDPTCAVACRLLDELPPADETSWDAFRAGGRRLRALLERAERTHPAVYGPPRGRGLIQGLPMRSRNDSSSLGLRGLSQHALLGPMAAGFLLHECGLRLLPCSGATGVLRFHAPPDLDAAEEARIERGLALLAERIERADFAGLCRYMVGLEGRPFAPEDWAVPVQEESDHPYARKVAFFGHFIKAEDMPLWDPSFTAIPMERRDALGERVTRLLGPVASPTRNVRSRTGEVVSLHFLGLPMTSAVILRAFAERDTGWIVDRIFEGIEHAIVHGCTVVGFGGFTAVLTHNCKDVVDDRIATTSGISFTVVAGIEAMARACEELGIDAAASRAGIAGSTGDLSRNYAFVLAQTVPELLLLDAEASSRRQETVAAELYFQAFKRIHRRARHEELGGLAARIAGTRAVRERLELPFPEQGAPHTLGAELRDALDEELGDDAPIRRSSRPEDLAGCSIVVSGAPRGRLPITAEMIGEGPVVLCDVALPASVDPELETTRPRCRVLTGGLVRLPFNEDFRVPGIPLDPGSTFGCMAETMLLGLTGIMEDFSVGQLTQIKIMKIKEIAAIHGFELGPSKTIPSM